MTEDGLKTDESPTKEQEFGKRFTVRFLALAGTVLIIATSLLTSFIGHVVQNTSEQQRQNDQLIDLQRRLEILEQIAKTNSEARIKIETKLDQFSVEHQYMLDQLRKITEILVREKESRRPSRNNGIEQPTWRSPWWDRPAPALNATGAMI